MLEETENKEVSEFYADLDKKPEKAEVKSKAKPAKPKPTPKNGKLAEAEDDTMFLLVETLEEDQGERVSVEVDARTAAAKAILNKNISLYRATRIEPDSVFQQ